MRPTREQLRAVIAEVKEEAVRSHAHRLASAVVKLAFVVEALVDERKDDGPAASEGRLPISSGSVETLPTGKLSWAGSKVIP